jgi:hypothetical protein
VRATAGRVSSCGATPGERLAAALGFCADAFWGLINYRWFDVVTGGWGLTARGRAEAIGETGRRTASGRACGSW